MALPRLGINFRYLIDIVSITGSSVLIYNRFSYVEVTTRRNVLSKLSIQNYVLLELVKVDSNILDPGVIMELQCLQIGIDLCSR